MTGKTIAFLSDLGLLDDAVGMCKGIMARRSPESKIIDINHNVTPFDVEEAAWYIRDLPEHFPDDTVFCCFVYPETGVRQSIVITNEQGQAFVAPDNGLLTRVVERQRFRAWRITNPEVILEPPSPTFYGRDVVVACAAHLAAGVPASMVGPPIADIVRLPPIADVVSSANGIRGTVTILDKHFGNVWTNIHAAVAHSCGLLPGTHLTVRIADVTFTCPFGCTFDDVEVGDIVAYVNSRDHLAFGINRGNLGDRLNVARGAPIDVQVRPLSRVRSNGTPAHRAEQVVGG